MPSLVVTATLSAMLVFAIGAVESPRDVLGATVSKTAICSANLRTGPTTSARVRKVVTVGTRVSVVATVTGGTWQTKCPRAVSARSWYRISAIGGTSVKSLYGVTYLYAATTLFTSTTVNVTRYADCQANLRTSAASSARARTTIARNTRVLVSTSVAGTSYSTTCSGKTVASNRWFRITAINGKSVKSLYGVSYLYAASLLFRASPTPPPAAARPFAAPVTSRTVRVPSSIDASGGSNAGPALQSFLNHVPNGSVIAFPAGGTYRVAAGLRLDGRHNLILDGHGSTIRTTGSGGSALASPIVLSWATANSDIWIRNFVLEGNNLRTGTSIYDPSRESQMGIDLNGGVRIEISGVTIRRTWGDAVYANENTPSAGSAAAWPTDIWVHHNRFDSIGRNAFTINAGRRVTLERNTIDHVGASVLDIEPDLPSQGADAVVLRSNTIGVYGMSPLYTGHFVSCSNDAYGVGAVIQGITITGNSITRGAPNSANNSNSGGLFTWIGKTRTSNIVFTNNTTAKAGHGYVLIFQHVDGLTVAGNHQVLTSGSLVAVSDSTNVSIK